MAVNDRLVSAQRVALDSSLFIYYIERHHEYFSIVAPIFDAISDGKTEGITSQLTLLDVLVQPIRQGALELANRYRAFLARSRNLKSIPISIEVLEKASQLRASSSIRTPDAIQMATAIVGQADLLVTNGERLVRIPDIRVISLSSLR